MRPASYTYYFGRRDIRPKMAPNESKVVKSKRVCLSLQTLLECRIVVVKVVVKRVASLSTSSPVVDSKVVVK